MPNVREHGCVGPTIGDPMTPKFITRPQIPRLEIDVSVCESPYDCRDCGKPIRQFDTVFMKEILPAKGAWRSLCKSCGEKEHVRQREAIRDFIAINGTW